jgi:hypothetical protein
MALGPLEYLVVGFEGNRFTGQILAELRAAHEKGIIRVLDMFVVNDLRLEAGGLWLPLDSTATQHTWRGVPLWLHGPRHQGWLTNIPSWPSPAGPGAS